MVASESRSTQLSLIRAMRRCEENTILKFRSKSGRHAYALRSVTQFAVLPLAMSLRNSIDFLETQARQRADQP